MGGGGDKIEHFCETHLFVVQQIHNVMYCTYCCAINCDFLCTLFSSLNHFVYRIDLYSLFIHLFIILFRHFHYSLCQCYLHIHNQVSVTGSILAEFK